MKGDLSPFKRAIARDKSEFYQSSNLFRCPVPLGLGRYRRFSIAPLFAIAAEVCVVSAGQLFHHGVLRQ